MPTLLIEHAITDFDTWSTAYAGFAERRRGGGVRLERIARPVDDPHYVIVNLDFDTLDEARAFQRFLETQVWSTPTRSPGLAGTPRARVVETVETAETVAVGAPGSAGRPA